MRKLTMTVAAVAMMALAGCGGKGDDKLGDQAEQALDNKADALDAAADNMSGPAKDAMEAKADATREAGDAKEEAIDDADVNAKKLTNAQRADVVKPD